RDRDGRVARARGRGGGRSRRRLRVAGRRARAPRARRGDRHSALGARHRRRGRGGVWTPPLPRAPPPPAARPRARPPRGRRRGGRGRGLGLRPRRRGRRIGTLAHVDSLASTGRSPWHRASALPKLTLALALVLIAVFAPSLRLLVAVHLLAWTLALSSRMPPR